MTLGKAVDNRGMLPLFKFHRIKSKGDIPWPFPERRPQGRLPALGILSSAVASHSL